MTTPTTPVVPTPAPVTPTTPAAPVETAPAKPEVNWQEKYNLKKQEDIVQRRKLERELAAARTEKESFQAKVAEFEKMAALAKRNMPAYMKQVYGDNWYDLAVRAKVDGASPSELLADEMQKLEERIEAKYSAREAEQKKAAEQSQSKQVETARNQLFAESAAFYRDAGKDYPIFARLGNEAQVARTIAQRIESEFHRTAKVEDGQVVQQGRVLTTREAADLIEGEMLALVEEAQKHEKYKSRLTPKDKPATVAESKQQSVAKQSKTLTNAITASTPGRQPAMSPKEKRERAMAAFAAARKTP